jgi:hypothetical protein
MYTPLLEIKQGVFLHVRWFITIDSQRAQHDSFIARRSPDHFDKHLTIQMLSLLHLF